MVRMKLRLGTQGVSKLGFEGQAKLGHTRFQAQLGNEYQKLTTGH
jgi:hypothetical protein